jgi:hypothetical protein
MSKEHLPTGRCSVFTGLERTLMGFVSATTVIVLALIVIIRLLLVIEQQMMSVERIPIRSRREHKT